jgi:RNA polymerase sigma-70 factor (ECF subfamily)
MLRFQSGDVACFEVLVDRHKQRVLNLTYRFLQGSNDAEDVAQEVFIRIYKGRKNYHASAQFTTWMHTICRNTCYSHLSKMQRRPLLLLGDLEDGDECSAMDRLEDETASLPDHKIMNEELVLAVKLGVDSLPDAQRMALLLARYEHCSYEQISQVMNCSTQAVKSLLNRARRNLKARLKKYI